MCAVQNEFGQHFFVLEVLVLQPVIWTLSGAALGAGCGCGALYWSRRLLQNRGRTEHVPRSAQCILVIAAAVCGGAIGFYTRDWLPLVSALAMLTVGITVSVSDWLCRIIPNPTVLTLFALKLVLIAGALLKIPGVPSFSLLSSLGGMAFCFLVFSAPGLTGKRVGAGDIKIAAAIGFLLGFNNALLAVAFMGLLVFGYSMLQRKMPLLTFLKTNIPMGPFIMTGMMFSWMVPYIAP